MTGSPETASVPRFVQLVADGQGHLHALDEAGTVWRLVTTASGLLTWVPLAAERARAA